MVAANQSVGALIYSGLIEQRGNSSKSINAFMTGTDVNAFAEFNAFIKTAEGQMIINSLVTGINNLSNESISGLLLGASSGTQAQSINALILNPHSTSSESINAFILAKLNTETINAGMNLTQKTLTGSFKGFMEGFNPAGTINALIFRPPASVKSFGGFVHGLDSINENINALVYFPSEEASESIKGFLQGHSPLSETLGGSILGISGTASGSFNAFMEAVQGVETETVNALINAITGSASGSINAFMDVIGLNSNQIQGYTVGGP